MSLIDSKNWNYLTAVERYFLKLKGAGLFLSAEDYHLICQWESRGVPLEPLCRSIERAHRQMLDESRRPIRQLSLSKLSNRVESELEALS